MIQIGIIRTSSIGDVVLSTAVLDFLEKLEQEYPKVKFKVYFITKMPSLSLISAYFPRITCLNSESFGSPKELIEQMKELDCLIDLQVNLRSQRLGRFFTKMTGKPTYRVKKDRLKRSLLVWTTWILGRSNMFTERSTEAPTRQFQSALEPVITALLKIGLNKDKVLDVKNRAHPLLRKNGGASEIFSAFSTSHWLAVAPGASYLPKQYPTARLSEILIKLKSFLPENASVAIVFLGDQNDFATAEVLRSQLSWRGPMVNMCGKTTLAETAELLTYCFATLSNDSSIGHISEAVGTPSGVFFGPTTELFGFAPFRKESKSFSAPISCRPCSKHGSRPCRYGDQKCFTDIDQEQVIAWVLSRLTLGKEISSLQMTQAANQASQNRDKSDE